ncbi:Inorganic phosphate transporter pho84 [Linnemannia exigua]|uniref:Inorganic phosphate transporter pho84 n=1 Tax=Linnemannia exigua TaxID=604196 RepID=A0AAD4DAT7_9FUNG|nr:Inorganic phosphate transporter pho84 [Linnemannia exigua]
MLTSIQGLGILMVSILTLMVLARFRAILVDGKGDDAENMNMVWRICIAVGCLPALLTALIHFTTPATVPMPATCLFENSQNCSDNGDVDVLPSDDLPENEQDLNDKADTCLFSPKRHFRWKNLKVLISTSLSKFLLNIAFRSISLNQSYLIDALDLTDSSSNNLQDFNNHNNSIPSKKQQHSTATSE